MNLKEKLTHVFSLLGLTQKAKDQSLSDDEWKAVVNRFQQEYKVTLQEAMAEENNHSQAPSISQEEITAAYNMVKDIVAEQTSQETSDGKNDEEDETAQTAQEENIPSMSQVLYMLGKVANNVKTMSHRAAPDKPLAETAPLTIHGYNGPADQNKFLFGIENSMFSMDNRWNKIAAQPSYAAANPVDEETDGPAFRKAVLEYSRSLKQRFNYLHQNNYLNQVQALSEGKFATDYSGVKSVPGGNNFIVLRQDALIARVLMKRDVTQYFPVRYGIQDSDLVFNAYFSEVSQAYQPGEVWKGGAEIQPERGYVDDAMIKLSFGQMKELERMYIAYLNKEGSDPIKWSMIEFFILNTLETAQVEQNKRRIRGMYVKPESGKPGSYLNTGTGILYTLVRYSHENKLLLNDDTAYRSYTQDDMLDAVLEFYSDVQSQCSEDMELDNMCIYLNKTHQPWYLKNVRAKYGKDIDFSGPDSYKYKLPDTEMRIIWLPYLGQLPLMFIQEPGNLQFLEYVPGEMLNFKLKEDMELVKGWSVWKEGCSAAFVGKNFDSAAALKENNFVWQQIFMNKPCISLADDATTCDATKGFWFETVQNTSASQKITDISNAKTGVVYIIECGNTTQPQSIDKSGKFSDITAAWNPSSVGDYIMVVMNSEKNFLELERCVGGKRTINAVLQPNVPGVR